MVLIMVILLVVIIFPDPRFIEALLTVLIFLVKLFHQEIIYLKLMVILKEFLLPIMVILVVEHLHILNLKW